MIDTTEIINQLMEAKDITDYKKLSNQLITLSIKPMKEFFFTYKSVEVEPLLNSSSELERKHAGVIQRYRDVEYLYHTMTQLVPKEKRDQISKTFRSLKKEVAELGLKDLNADDILTTITKYKGSTQYSSKAYLLMQRLGFIIDNFVTPLGAWFADQLVKHNDFNVVAIDEENLEIVKSTLSSLYNSEVEIINNSVFNREMKYIQSVAQIRKDIQNKVTTYAPDRDSTRFEFYRRFKYKPKFNEDINGGFLNTVYHKTDDVGLEGLLKTKKFSKTKIGKLRGIMYGNGVYTIYDLEKNLDFPWAFNYGRHILKCVVDIHNFLIFDYDISKKLYGKNYTIKSQVRNVFKITNKSVLDVVDSIDDDMESQRNYERTNDLNITSKFALTLVTALSGTLNDYFSGIIYTGNNDGRCCVAYNLDSIKVISFYSNKKEHLETTDIKFTQVGISMQVLHSFFKNRLNAHTGTNKVSRDIIYIDFNLKKFGKLNRDTKEREIVDSGYISDLYGKAILKTQKNGGNMNFISISDNISFSPSKDGYTLFYKNSKSEYKEGLCDSNFEIISLPIG